MGTGLLTRLRDKNGVPFDVRSYDAADRAALEAMYDAFEPKRAAQGLPPADRASTRRWLDRTLATGRHLLVEFDGDLVGHVMLIPCGEATVELANFLHQSIRNRGVGTALNRYAIDVARDDGYTRVWLSVEPSNRAALRSYEKAGFKRMPGSLWAPEIEMEAFTAT